MKICPNCQREYTEDYTFCLNDGTSLLLNPVGNAQVGEITKSFNFCGKCGMTMLGEYTFCKGCGAPRRSFEEVKTIPPSVGANTESGAAVTDASRWFQENKQILIIAGGVCAVLLMTVLYFVLSDTESVATANNSNANFARINANTNRAVMPMANTGSNIMPPGSSYNDGQTARLTTDLNIREEPNKYAASVGIHFRGARIKILDSTTYQTPEGEMVTWYQVRVLEYGCSADANLGCGKNSSTDRDDGWLNGKYLLFD